MEDRITLLEREVAAIKSDVAGIRRDRVNAAELSARISRTEFEMAEMKADIAAIKVSIAAMQTLIAEIKLNFVTKAELHEAIGSLKGWMLAMAFSTLTLNFGMNFFFYNAIRTDLAGKLAQASQALPAANPAPVVKN
jgi:hypothetical protein